MKYAQTKKLFSVSQSVSQSIKLFFTWLDSRIFMYAPSASPMTRSYSALVPSFCSKPVVTT